MYSYLLLSFTQMQTRISQTMWSCWSVYLLSGSSCPLHLWCHTLTVFKSDTQAADAVHITCYSPQGFSSSTHRHFTCSTYPNANVRPRDQATEQKTPLPRLCYYRTWRPSMCCCVLEIRSISVTSHNFTSVLLIHSQKAIKPVSNNKVNPKLEPAENGARQANEQMVGVLDGVVMQCETEEKNSRRYISNTSKQCNTDWEILL